jgi:hypothetical protein
MMLWSFPSPQRPLLIARLVLHLKMSPPGKVEPGLGYAVVLSWSANMTIPSELLELWKQHSSSAFPKGYGDKEINRIDLSLMDAEISGSIRLYILNDGKIDRQQVKILRERLIDLNAIILLMDHDEFVYFDRLRQMANLVLQEMEKTIG